MRKRLITSALPYVNNVPHLGNLIQVLSADVFSRYCRSRGFESLYVCGTDEYGTATETKALEEKITPQQLCDKYYDIHSEIYAWFNIDFDYFGRTSTPNHTKVAQEIFKNLEKNGFIEERKIQQLYCASCGRFLADRYVKGTCPACRYDEARGDQCENCGKLLDPTDLLDPRCGTCGNAPVIRDTDHLYLNLPAVLPQLQKWMETVQNNWAWNAVQMTQAWIRDGLKERCITRDLKWGIPVPKRGYEDKVFYVWFDAPIGYISITLNHLERVYQDRQEADRVWQSWWKNPAEVDLYQFIGKDNIPFHTVIFPSSLLGSGEDWTLLKHMSSSEYLNYETGKFSKSKGVGVFGTDARETGIPADVWRFYIFYNRPEKADTLFQWKDFQEKVNSELIGNLANLVNRSLTFVLKNFGGDPFAERPAAPAPASTVFWREVRLCEGEIAAALEKVELKEGLRKILALSSIGNKRFQDEEPWRLIKEDRPAVAGLLADLIYLIRDLAILINPYLPQTAGKLARFLGLSSLNWENLGTTQGVTKVGEPELLFKKLEDKEIEVLRARFAGTQKERAMDLKEKFTHSVDIRVAKITEIKRHPKADKLYIETISFGRQERQIVSGLVPYYAEDELLGRNVLVVYNLSPATLRGVESQGMLLAAEVGDTVEVIFADEAQPGDRVSLQDKGPDQCSEISIDEFFEITIRVHNFTLQVDGSDLLIGKKPVRTETVEKGIVG